MKYKILEELKTKNSFVSGEALSEVLGVSRAAVWKYIKELQGQGYIIESSSRKGYKLLSSCDILNEFEIGWGLKTRIVGRNIYYFDKIDSTNNFAKEAAYQGCEDGTVIVADKQTSGRGRLGRNWESAEGKGIWMSVVLRPSITPEDTQIITIAASVAVVSALKKVVGIEAGIKWPNDIILDNRKLCGILTEMSSEMERVNFLVLGIGMNVNHGPEDFSEELKNYATSLGIHAKGRETSLKSDDNVVLSRSEIIKGILFELEQLYEKINNGRTYEIIESWKKYSVTLGKEVILTVRNEQYTGIAKDITGDGKLVVECSDGTTREVMSGEVRVRGLMGYI